MIEINLVPPNLRRKQNRGVGLLKSIDLPKEVIMGVGTIFLGIIILMHAFLLVAYGVKLSHQWGLKVTWHKMLPERKNIDSFSQEMKDIKMKFSTVSAAIGKGDVVWSQTLNSISDALPKGVWLRKLSWEQKTLILEGFAFTRTHDEIITVGNFVSNLKKEESFANNFTSVELNSVMHSKRGMTEVAEFKVTAKAK